MTNQPAEGVWNRAAMEAGGSDPRPGDSALAALLLFHNLAMNGGVLHAIESLDDVEIERAVAGFRFFTLDEPASFLTDATRRWRQSDRSADLEDQLEAEFDLLYAALIPDDDVLFAALLEKLAARPTEFSPVDQGVT